MRVLVAVVYVVRASARVWWNEPRCDLPELVNRLRRAPRARFDLDVEVANGIVERLLAVLPPWRAGRCVKRSLLQLDLWSRAGKVPRFHLGVFESAERAGHVWVSLDGTVPHGIAETWSG